MIGPFEIIGAFLLDLAIGDPRWLPHPVRIIGKAVSRVELVLRRFFSSPTGERIAGIALVIGIVVPVYFITDGIVIFLNRESGNALTVLSGAFIVYLAATTIAARELIGSAQLVIDAIKNGDLQAGRRRVSMIVGRDTQELSGKGVLKATIETLAENLSDGIIAPLFYLAIGGLPLAMAYKAVNTLDSMVGYKNEKYRYFGWAAARLDDAANYIPARASGLAIVLSVFLTTLFTNSAKAVSAAASSWKVMIRDGRNHTSPNSGVPEAAMAGALGIMLGGPSAYGGVLVHKPSIGDEEQDDYLSASYDAVKIVRVSSVLAALAAVTAAAVRSFQ